MDNIEKKKWINSLMVEKNLRSDEFQYALEKMGDLKCHYSDYLTTAPINCDEELKHLPNADYELCTALLTMLIREDQYICGKFDRRLRRGEIRPILERMLELLN